MKIKTMKGKPIVMKYRDELDKSYGVAGMVLGLTPVIGIPLPFFSYGGSSLWGFTFLLFIFLALDARRNLVRL